MKIYSVDVTQTLLERIESLLSTPGAKSAKQIARELGVARKEVNSILYREIEKFASVGLDPPLWLLLPTKDSDSTSRTQIKTTDSSKVLPSKHWIAQQTGDHQLSGKSQLIEMEDLVSSIQRITCNKNFDFLLTNESYPTNERITKAWIGINVPKKLQAKFHNLLKEHFGKDDEVLLGELLDSLPALQNSLITRNFGSLMLLRGYTSIESIAQFASQGRLYSHTDFPYLISLKQEPEIHRLVQDLEILNRRSSGETLESISRTYEITRERIRQRLRGMSIYGVNLSPVEIRNTKKTLNEDRQASLISSFILQYPGCTKLEIQESLNLSNRELAKHLDARFRRFIAPEKRNVANLMSREEILEAIKLASTFEYPLSGPGFDELLQTNLVSCVSRMRIMQIFGSWSNACELAGVESLAPVRSSYDHIWTESDLWQYLVDFILSPQTSNSTTNYDCWAREKPGDRPSTGTLRNYLGSWSEIVGLALLKIREDPYHSKFKKLMESPVAEL
jgi:hypothetical protein